VTYQTPCQNPENNPDDWFIGRDGKQYPDDDLLTEAGVEDIFTEVRSRITPEEDGYVEEADKAIARAEAQAKREALIARRKARAACYECYFRGRCLDIALDNVETHGTWGGYYEEELRQIRNARDARRNRNAT
jgi:hypothetical protein